MVTKIIKKRVTQKQKQKQTQKQKQKQTSKAIGNIVNINVPQAKRKYTRRQASKTSQPSSSTSVVTQIHQLPIQQYPMIMPELLGTNNLKSAQLSGDLGIIRNNEINNQSPFSIGGNQDSKILTSAERADALIKSIASKQPANLLGILNEQDNIPVPSMKELPIRKLSPQRELSKPIGKLSIPDSLLEEFFSRYDKPRKTFSQLENEAKGTSSLFDYLLPADLKKLRKAKTGDNSIFEPIDNSVEEHRKSLLKSMANHETGLKQTRKDENALYGYKKDGTPKKKTGRKQKSD